MKKWRAALASTAGSDAILPTLFALLTLGYSLRYHEPWRDEAHTFILAREVPLRQFLDVAHMEGAPPLFHLLLKLLGVFLPGQFALALGNSIGFAVLLFGAQQVLRSMDVSRPLAALAVVFLGTTDAFTYEFGIIARPYGFALGLALLTIADLLRSLDARRPNELLLRAGVFAGASTLMATHAGCIAGAALVAYAITAVARGERGHAMLPFVAFAPCFYLETWIISDAARAVAPTVVRNPTWTYGVDLAKTFFESGLGPTRWWFTQAEYAEYDLREVSAPLHLAIFIAMVRGFFASKKSVSRTGLAVLTVLVSWVPLTYILILRYGGWFRHWVHLWIPAIVLGLGGLLGRSRLLPRASIVVSLAGLWFLVPWWRGQNWALRETLERDRTQLLSETKNVAPLLPHGARLVGSADWLIEPLFLWRPDLTMRAASGNGRYFRYIVPDAAWDETVPYQGLVTQECAALPTEPVYLITQGPLANACLSRVEHPQRPEAWEHLEVYAVGCSCWSALPR